MNSSNGEIRFYFDDDNVGSDGAECLEVKIGKEIQRKADLLAALDVGLAFPDYFGGNWDALWECICDLSWLRSYRVKLTHADVPLRGTPDQLRTYVFLLNDAIAHWEHNRAHKLVVVFPKEHEAYLQEVMAH